MSVLTFPASPTLNQIYTFGNKAWQWDGAAWDILRLVGAPGQSAYDIAVNNGFVGTEAQWLVSLQATIGADDAVDALGTALVAGSGIGIVVDDVASTITLSSSGTYTDNQAITAVGASLVAGAGLSVAVDNTAHTITLTNTTTGYTNNQAITAVGAALVSGAGLSLVVDNTAHTITLANTVTQYTNTMAQDATAASIVAGSGISVSYDSVGHHLTISAIRNYRVGWFFTFTPTASEVILIHTFTDSALFAANFAGAVGFLDGTLPTSTYVLDIQKNNVSVGSISIDTSGVSTYTSTGGVSVLFNAGDRLKIVAPATAQPVTNASGTFKGTI